MKIIHLIRSTILSLLMSLPVQADIKSKSSPLSSGAAVPVGELEAVGRLPGCTATLIGQRLVLTAAHCVCPSDDNSQGCVTRSHFTFTNVYPKDNPATPQNESQYRTDVTVPGNVIVHPNYTAAGWLRKDLALLVLDRPAWEVVKNVQPLPVSDNAHQPKAGEMVVLVGYGRTGKGCTEGSLGKQWMALTVSEIVPDAIRFDHRGLVACPGDSGGPSLNNDGWLVGVASWSNDTDESTYRPAWESLSWINSIKASTESSTIEGSVVVSGTSRDLDAYRKPRQYQAKSPASPVVGIGIAGSNDVVYAWHLDGTVSAGNSVDLASRRKPYPYTLPPGKRPEDIVDIAIAGSNDHVYAWYLDGTFSSGSSADLDRYQPLQPYSMPPGKSPSDIVGIGIAGSNDWVYTWYADGTVSIGNSRHLGGRWPSQSVSFPTERHPQHILSQGIAGSNDHVYTWFKPYLR